MIGRSFPCSCVLIILSAGMSCCWHAFVLFPYFPFCSSMRSLITGSVWEGGGVGWQASLSVPIAKGKMTSGLQSVCFWAEWSLLFFLLCICCAIPALSSTWFACLIDFYIQGHCWPRSAQIKIRLTRAWPGRLPLLNTLLGTCVQYKPTHLNVVALPTSKT